MIQFFKIVNGLLDHLTVEFKKNKPIACQLDPCITNREFKFLLKPEGLDQRSQINRLIHLINAFCESNKVDLLSIDHAATSLRLLRQQGARFASPQGFWLPLPFGLDGDS